MIMAGAQNASLVVLSILIAIFGSFTALDVANRIGTYRGLARRIWLWAAAVTLGGSVWAMHFVAMLAFSIPGVQMTYDLGLTALSLSVAILFTAAGFMTAGYTARIRGKTIAAGTLMGCGFLAMHYIGMAAMRMAATLTYDDVWVAASAVIAIGAATGALWLASREQGLGQKVTAAAVMGGAIAGMHYAGMRAAIFTHVSHRPVPGSMATVDQTYLAIAISVVTALILLLALIAARLDRLLLGFARREERISLRLKVADILRNGSSLEALNEIAALMGQHFGAARTGYGQLDPADDTFSYEVCWTNGLVPPLLGRFPASAFGVKIVSALKKGVTVVVEDLFDSELSDDELTRGTALEVDTRSILVVPFLREGELRTIVYLNDRSPRRWRADDIAFMEELAERTRLVIERDAVESKLRELNATLEARVEARTAELREAQDALLQSRKMEAIGQLASGLAHDFNNLLGAVLGAFELIGKRAEEPDRVRHFAVAGVQAAQRGSRLTAQLLAFSRSQNIQLQPIIVCDIIENLRDMLTRTLGPMITLRLDLNPSPRAVLADATQVEMSLLNLAINARDAMPEGGVLEIATEVRTVADDPALEDRDYVVITVSDTGAGMDAETLQRAMEPFFTTKPLGKGTGLGLAQIYGSARQAGGTVRIESAPGQGTTVSVFLPCTPRTPIRLDGSVEDDAAPDAPIEVLIVDDDNDHRKILSAGLEAMGHRVVEAVDGASALAEVASKVPDVVLLDFAMPGMNGAQVAQELRRRCPTLPIVFISGFADTQAIEAVEGEQARILRKPFRMLELQSALRTATASR